MAEAERTTNATPGTVAADLKSLREDFGKLRSDLGTDIATVREDLRRLARDTSEMVTSRGKRAVETVEHRVEEHPISTLLLAFSAGMVVGLLFGRSLASSHETSHSRVRQQQRSYREQQSVTGTPDEQYDLISALYHTIEGAWKYDQYIQDAEQRNDRELAELFRQAQAQHRQLAAQARQLLGQRLS